MTRCELEHTFVTFEVLHFGTSTLRGRIGPITGEVTLDRRRKTGDLRLRIPVATREHRHARARRAPEGSPTCWPRPNTPRRISSRRSSSSTPPAASRKCAASSRCAASASRCRWWRARSRAGTTRCSSARSAAAISTADLKRSRFGATLRRAVRRRRRAPGRSRSRQSPPDASPQRHCPIIGRAPPPAAKNPESFGDDSP